MEFSKLFTLNGHDLLKGAIMAAGGAAYAILEPLLSAGNFLINWGSVAQISAGSALIYLLKNFFTPEPKTVIINPDKTEVKHGNLQAES